MLIPATKPHICARVYDSAHFGQRPRVLAMFPFYNEAHYLRKMVRKLRNDLVDEFLGVDNGSTDGGASILRERGLRVLDQPRRGVGNCIRTDRKSTRLNSSHVSESRM